MNELLDFIVLASAGMIGIWIIVRGMSKRYEEEVERERKRQRFLEEEAGWERAYKKRKAKLEKEVREYKPSSKPLSSKKHQSTARSSGSRSHGDVSSTPTHIAATSDSSYSPSASCSSSSSSSSDGGGCF